MNTTTWQDAARPRGAPADFLERLAARAVLGRLAAIEHGALTLDDGAQRRSFGAADAHCPMAATVRVNHPRFYSEVAFGGSIGAGEAYMDRCWEADDLTAVMRILLANRGVLDDMEGGFARAAAPLRRLLHWAARNSRAGSTNSRGSASRPPASATASRCCSRTIATCAGALTNWSRSR